MRKGTVFSAVACAIAVLFFAFMAAPAMAQQTVTITTTGQIGGSFGDQNSGGTVATNGGGTMTVTDPNLATASGQTGTTGNGGVATNGNTVVSKAGAVISTCLYGQGANVNAQLGATSTQAQWGTSGGGQNGASGGSTSTATAAGNGGGPGPLGAMGTAISLGKTTATFAVTPTTASAAVGTTGGSVAAVSGVPQSGSSVAGNGLASAASLTNPSTGLYAGGSINGSAGYTGTTAGLLTITGTTYGSTTPGNGQIVAGGSTVTASAGAH